MTNAEAKEALDKLMSAYVPNLSAAKCENCEAPIDQCIAKFGQVGNWIYWDAETGGIKSRFICFPCMELSFGGTNENPI